MTKSRRVEVIEIPTEQLSYVPGPHRDRFAMLGRWSVVGRHPEAAATYPETTAPSVAAAQTAPRTAGDVGTAAFRRLIKVPGGQLAVVLGVWWQYAEHDDGHLRLDVPRPVGDAWSLSGAFRRTTIARWIPVELLLSPYADRWTLLELLPRRAVHPGRGYFRAGHRSLDRFVANLCVGRAARGDARAEIGPGQDHGVRGRSRG
jgi:hypothetical protein